MLIFREKEVNPIHSRKTTVRASSQEKWIYAGFARRRKRPRKNDNF